VAVKILENVADNIEEIEEEYLVLRDLSMHPNIPAFHGLFLRPGQTQEEDQLWFVMEVSLCQYALGVSITVLWDNFEQLSILRGFTTGTILRMIFRRVRKIAKSNYGEL
jgi:serine/threonine protein kinase